MRGQHKRIFAQDSRQGRDQRQASREHAREAQPSSPLCFFHKDNLITKFCSCKECTLPLCSICEQIHLSEHKKHMTSPLIIGYAAARQSAFQSISSYLHHLKHSRDSAMSMLLSQKTQIQQTVNAFFEELVAELEAVTVSEGRVMELERREEKIGKGSVKAVIQHFADQYTEVRFPRVLVSFSAGEMEATLRRFVWLEGTNGTEGKAAGQGGIQIYQQQKQQQHQIHQQQMQYHNQQQQIQQQQIQHQQHIQQQIQHHHQQQQLQQMQHNIQQQIMVNQAQSFPQPQSHPPQLTIKQPQPRPVTPPPQTHTIQTQSKPSSSLSYHSFINKDTVESISIDRQAGDPQKCLEYSPKPLIYAAPPSFVQQQPGTRIQQQPSPHTPPPMYTHSVPMQVFNAAIHSTPITTPMTMSLNTPKEYVTPIQKLQTQERIVRPASDYEKKENIDINRMIGHIETANLDVNRIVGTEKTTTTTFTHTLPKTETNITPAAPLTSAQITSKSIPKPEDIMRTFRPNSAHSKSKEKDWTMTGKILSPEEIKAMIGKRAAGATGAAGFVAGVLGAAKNSHSYQQQATNEHTATEVTYVRHTDVSKDLGAPYFNMLGHGVEMKQSYFDHLKQPVGHGNNVTSSFQATYGQNKQRHISNFSPTFNIAQQQSNNEAPYEIKVFKPIEGNTLLTQITPKELPENYRPKSPYEIRYNPNTNWDSKILSVDDLRTHLASNLQPANH